MPSIANGFELRVDLTEMSENLKKLGSRISQNLIRRGLLAGAGIIRDEARRNVSVRTGALKRAIISETDRKSSNQAEWLIGGMKPGTLKRDIAICRVRISHKAFSVGAKGKIKEVGRKEQGARGKLYVRGEIYPRNYAHLVEFGTRPHMVGGRQHPGAHAKPFLTKAWDEKSDEARRKIKEVIGIDLNIELRKATVKNRKHMRLVS